MVVPFILDREPNLSMREVEILECVAAGMSAKEVARQVELAPRTVERYIENIRLKMHARNSVHMVTCAIQMKMIDISA